LELAKKGKLDGAGFLGGHSMGYELPVLTLAHTGRPSTARNCLPGSGLWSSNDSNKEEEIKYSKRQRWSQVFGAFS
jgi:hypothetical protein